MTEHDPMHDAVAACWSTLAAFNAAYARDPSGDGVTPEVIATDDAFHAAWNAALTIVPTTVAGAGALAKCGLDLARVREVDEYSEQAVQALATNCARPPVNHGKREPDFTCLDNGLKVISAQNAPKARTRSRVLPPYHAIPQAWAALSPKVQADLGCALVEWVLADFVYGDGCPDEYQYCTAEIRGEACERAQTVFNTLPERVRAELPDLFGPEPGPAFPNGGDPEWAWRDEGELLALAAEVRAEGRKSAKRLRVVMERLRTLAIPAELHREAG